MQRGKDLEDWLLNWENLYTQGRTLQTTEVIDPHDAIYTFLDAIGPCEFRGPWKHKLEKQTKSYEFEEVLQQYRTNRRQERFTQKPRGEHGVFALQEDDNSDLQPMLQGRTNNLQQ
ncbi:hypothetical protein GMDG_08797, partial [Pseudogymnoascus destructans 20631-21]